MIPKSSEAHYKQQQRLAVATSRAAQSLWKRMGSDFDASWAGIKDPLVGLLAAGQLAAARDGAAYLPKVLAETRRLDLPIGEVRPEAFSGHSAAGLELEPVLYNSVIRTKTRVGQGESVKDALSSGGDYLSMVVLSELADAGRGSVHAGIGSRPTVAGWVRMLNTPSCPQCIILAGKWFRWNQGFQRHPNCDCRHIPSAESMAGDFTTDPYAYFNSLTPEEQDKLFRPHGVSRERAAQVGISNARGIRAGGDIYRVENIRLRGVGTSKAKKIYGTPQVTLDDIYRVAGNRSGAIRLMTEHGYITGPQVAGGNILGNLNTDAKILARGRGKGTFSMDGSQLKTNRAKVFDSVESGVRNPLDRVTLTAAERRMFDAKYKYEVALSGTFPRSVGRSSSDKFVRSRAPSAAELAAFERDFVKEAAIVQRSMPKFD